VNVVGTPLSDWLAQIETLSPHEIDLGLERVERVLQRLAVPRPQSVFHVAGTNGKGSSVAMLEALLQQTDARIGCYTSPHISRYNERIRVDGDEATDEQIIAAFERIEAVRDGEALSYFEFGTLAAVIVFADAGVDTAILEIGMGGRLDAVNAIEPDAGLITNIALDHCEWLGDNIETIAFEKAGIMRRNKPIIFGARDIPLAILEHADAAGANLLAAGRDFDWSVDGDRWSWQGVAHRLEGLERPALAGDHQFGNAATVLALLEAAGLTGLLRTDIVNTSLGSLRLAGRLQQFDIGARWLLDVAHNPAAAKVLGEALRGEGHDGRTVAIVALLDDKDVAGCIAHLQDQVEQWIAVTAASPRAIDAGELARQVANASNRACLVADSLEDAIIRAQELTKAGDRVLVTGSFYLVGPVLDLLSKK
jgi:dihydrofolate synthase/folylpolyglutamate synthase